MKRIGYFNGTIGDYDDMQIPFSDRSVFYGDAVYDAVLVLNRRTFTLDMHLDRLYKSCAMTKIPFDMPREVLKGEIDRLLSLSEMGSIMLYLQVTRGAAPRKHEFPDDAEPNLLMFTSAVSIPPRDKRASLVSVEDLRFQYCNIKTTNLLPNVFAAQKAKEAGATEALLHRGDRVTEAAHSSILMAKDGTVIMPPLDELILPGITREIVRQICEEAGIPTVIRIFTVDELMKADEIMLCSTTKNVIFVYEIDRQQVGGKDRALREKIQELFARRVCAETGVSL
ncbi:MAG: aminotransferase class IV [Clostridia bacterium]|nr:aminotransferase class IV [Clostridia bacterium]